MSRLILLKLKADSLDKLLVEFAEKHDMGEWLEFESSTINVLGYRDTKALNRLLNYKIKRLSLPLVALKRKGIVFVVHKWKTRPIKSFRDLKFEWG